METAWLEDFLAVLTEGGFSRAADSRAVSQPAFSRRIRALEDWLGTAVFERGSHAVRLTAAGQRFQPTAEDILRRLQIGRQDAVSAAQEAFDTLRLSATHVLSLTFFPGWLRTLEACEPTASTVQLTADNMVACERLMVEGRVQFLLCHSHPAATTRLTSETFCSIVVGHDVLLPVAAPHLYANGLPSETPCLAYTSESGMGRILAATRAASGHALPRAPAFSSHLASVLATMAREGRGIAWAPLSLVREDIDAGRLIRTLPDEQAVPMEIRLYRPRARQSATAEALWARALKVGIKD